MRYQKYNVWSVVIRETTTLVYVGLGTKDEIIRRYRELTKSKRDTPIEIHHRLKGTSRNYITFKFYKTYDWKPDCLAELETLALQYKWLLVEDLTGESPMRIT